MARCILQRAVVLAALMTLAGCAVSPQHAPAPALARELIREFSLQARLAITRGSERATVNIDWQHQRGGDDITVLSPLGQTLARLTSSSMGAALEAPNRDIMHAADIEDLAERALGTRLPLKGLPQWVLGRAVTADAVGQRDALGRWTQLTESGWHVVFTQYESDSVDALPQLIDLARGQISIRIRNDQWSVRP